MQAPEKRERSDATMGAAAVTSPTETAWTQIRGIPAIREAVSWFKRPNLGPKLFRYLPVRSILAP